MCNTMNWRKIKIAEEIELEVGDSYTIRENNEDADHLDFKGMPNCVPRQYLTYAGMPNKDTFSCVISISQNHCFFQQKFIRKEHFSTSEYAYNLFFSSEKKEINILGKRLKVLNVSVDSIVLESLDEE